MYRDKELVIRPIVEQDLQRVWELIYKEEKPEWKKWDAPYYPHKSIPFEEFMEDASSWLNQEDFWVITSGSTVCGTVNYYFEDDSKKWLEFGIAIYEPNNWNKRIGTRALKLWVNHIFNTLPVVRVGLTTWSGNKRMIHVGEKLGLTMEARIRKVRYYNENYYDSIRLGLLREEWEELDYYS